MTRLNRRQFLQTAGASAALATGLSACGSYPYEKFLPYDRHPEELVPGRPLYYATTLTLGGAGLGVLVESHLGRPTKVEGNPDHPASLGATDAVSQAAVRSLYDPGRAKTVAEQGRPREWLDFLAALGPALDVQRAGGGAGLRLLTETVTSPTLAAQIQRLLTQFPNARWHQWEPINQDNAQAGAVLVYGAPLDTIYRLADADVILSLDADFLMADPRHLPAISAFARRRQVRLGPGGGARPGEPVNRLYSAGSAMTVTAASADHHLPVRSSAVAALVRAVAAAVDPAFGPAPPLPAGIPPAWPAIVARDLAAHRGRGLVIPGLDQPPAVHALAHALNASLGNTGRTVFTIDPIAANPVDQTASLRDLVTDLAAGSVDVLIVLDANPVYSAPIDIPFGQALAQARLSACLSLFPNETSAACHWQLPRAHVLESWGDARAFDGTISPVQPLIAPLYQGKSPEEVLALLIDRQEADGQEIVRGHWRAALVGGGDFESVWLRSLRDGVLAGSARPPRTLPLTAGWADRLAAAWPVATAPAGEALEIVFRPDPYLYDGRFAENPWLRELPQPVTKLTWDNAALISPATAARLGLDSEDVVVLEFLGRSIEAPVWEVAGQADETVVVHLGYGRTDGAAALPDGGFSAYALRSSAVPWFGTGLTIRRTGRRYELASTQGHHRMEGRDIVRLGTFQQLFANPDFLHERYTPTYRSMYPEWPYPGQAWGMVIDQTVCTGCNACVIACQAENNIPTVGKDQVRVHREMHWLRVDSYYHELSGTPGYSFQPLPCMHCEKAPCEYVCPVTATAHSDDGLNDMVYNRCVGTRYCALNCPYKVRRFNYLAYNDFDPPATLKMLPNPDVTVRSRGVMEKCTYCVQRIRGAEAAAKREGRQLVANEVLTACQAVCPANAIVFGDINNPASLVTQWRQEPTGYALLAHLQTQPRTTYLADLRHPNPELTAD